MVKVLTYFGMTLGAFVFWQTMDKVHVWIALHQDEKVNFPLFPTQIEIGLRIWSFLKITFGIRFGFSIKIPNNEMGYC
ncbi:uncharacterized protein LOC126795087 [Argentina anserina]|uniref:uncharacterized protein LOC126795087 n=1 Tax=Argentina anserina TaxID=57926 RepID=UPI0021762075|nr:uncharacterized protein LOC126795087 [Potentilla anserina]